MPVHGSNMEPDALGGAPGTVGAGDLESTIDVGGTTARSGRDELDDLGRELHDDPGLDGTREIDGDRVGDATVQAAFNRAQSAARAEEIADKEAAMAEAHENGEAFYWGDTTHDGETVQEWILPDGTTILVDDDGQAVSIEYPPGGGPIYIGDITYQGEPHAVYEMPGGSQVVVNEDGDVIGELDDLDYSLTVPLGLITGNNQDIADGEMVTVTVTPLGPPSYNTVIVDAETGEVYDRIDTGGDALGVNVGQTGTDMAAQYSTYQPPGADYALVIDAEGNVVDTVAIPEEPEWSFLGVVEYYEDGTVVVDVGAVEVSVDVVGPEGGISVDFDLLIAEGTAGIEWDEDGSWSFDTSVDLDIEGAEVGVGLGFGQDAKGNAFLDIETSLEMNIGAMHLEGGQWLHLQQTDEGFEANAGWEGTVDAFGAYLHHRQEGSIVLDDDGLTGTYYDEIGAGIKGLGGIHVTSETQVRTDGTWGGTSATQGAYGAIVDKDGDDVVGGGVYADTERGLYTSSEHLDDGRDYERSYATPDLPAAPDGGADFTFSDGSHPGDGSGREFADRSSGPGTVRDAFDEVAADRPRAERSAVDPRERNDGPLRADVEPFDVRAGSGARADAGPRINDAPRIDGDVAGPGTARATGAATGEIPADDITLRVAAGPGARSDAVAQVETALPGVTQPHGGDDDDVSAVYGAEPADEPEPTAGVEPTPELESFDQGPIAKGGHEHVAMDATHVAPSEPEPIDHEPVADHGALHGGLPHQELAGHLDGGPADDFDGDLVGDVGL